MNHPALEKIIFFRGRLFLMGGLDLFDLIGYHSCPQVSSSVFLALSYHFEFLKTGFPPTISLNSWKQHFGSNLLAHRDRRVVAILFEANLFPKGERFRYICVDCPLCRACKCRGIQYRRHSKHIESALAQLVIRVHLGLYHVLVDFQDWYFVNYIPPVTSNELSCIFRKSCDVSSCFSSKSSVVSSNFALTNCNYREFLNVVKMVWAFEAWT